MANKLYNNLAIASILVMLPFVVAAGAFVGYLCTDWLARVAHISGWLFTLIIILGFLSGIFESMRMLKLAIRMDKEK